jgi:hypothetical protein
MMSRKFTQLQIKTTLGHPDLGKEKRKQLKILSTILNFTTKIKYLKLTQIF